MVNPPVCDDCPSPARPPGEACYTFCSICGIKRACPDDDLPGEPPEVFEECPECCGEGAIEQWESVSKWSIDPPSAHVIPCTACGGAGGMICEAASDPEGFASYDTTECPF